jgi:hypothetical protein
LSREADRVAEGLMATAVRDLGLLPQHGLRS